MGIPVDALIDLDRYPVLDADANVVEALIEDARAQLTSMGAVELPGFLNPTGVAALVADAEALAPRAHHSAGEGTPYLEYPDFSLPAGHPRLTWGPAHAGMASGVLWAVADEIIAADSVDDLVLIAAVWVNPAAVDETLVYENNRTATRDALAAGARQLPTLGEALEYRDRALNAYYLPTGIT